MPEMQCVLAFMAHPDDAEFTCAGTLARLRAEHGWRVVIATMTAGDCGSADRPPEEISRLRLAEARAAAQLLDADYHCVGLQDLFICYDRDALQRTTELIRRARPNLVITHSPQDYIVDHEMTSTLVRAACFGAPMPNYLTGAACHRLSSTGAGAAEPAPPIPTVPHLYYADALEGRDILGRPIEPTTLVDVTSAMAVKERMLCCHASQRDWLRRHHGMDEYTESMRRWMAMRGEAIGTAYAEGFRRHRGHGYPQDDLLAALLGALKQT